MALVKESEALQEELVSWRRYVHQHPEIGLETPGTARFIAEKLTSFGLEVRTGVGGNGVVGLLKGNSEGKVFAIRADIDALPVAEDTELPFASSLPGRMHACGHDAHVAMALGAAKVLSNNRDKIKGAVKFIFQPAEEGPGGAVPMIQDGALENPDVDAIIGAHIGVIWDLKSGQVGVRSGPMMAATDRMNLKIVGKGGHGAMPHTAIDPIVIGAQCVTALQTIVSREISPVEPAVVTVGQFHAGTVNNVIPHTAELGFTIRYFNPDLKDVMKNRLHDLLGGIVTSMRGTYEMSYEEGYPPTVNDPAFTQFFSSVAADVLGSENVISVPEPTMGGEDMSFFLNRVPGTFFTLGAAPCERSFPHHHPKFDIDESVFWKGTALFVETAIRWLQAQ